MHGLLCCMTSQMWKCTAVGHWGHCRPFVVVGQVVSTQTRFSSAPTGHGAGGGAQPEWKSEQLPLGQQQELGGLRIRRSEPCLWKGLFTCRRLRPRRARGNQRRQTHRVLQCRRRDLPALFHQRRPLQQRRSVFPAAFATTHLTEVRSYLTWGPVNPFSIVQLDARISGTIAVSVRQIPQTAFSSFHCPGSWRWACSSNSCAHALAFLSVSLWLSSLWLSLHPNHTYAKKTGRKLTKILRIVYWMVGLW